jgi:SAM-dependent methyltransferase
VPFSLLKPVPPRIDWAAYLRRFHREHPGITEDLLAGARRDDVGTAYTWMTAALAEHPGRVIDVACGSAPLRPLFDKADAYLGVDVSRSELARAQLEQRGPLARASVMALPLSDGFADAVMCSMAIMLFEPIEDGLFEIARVLRSGGTFVTIRPVSWPVLLADARIGTALLRGLHRMPALPQRLTRRAFARMQADAGLTVVADHALRFGYPLETHTDAQRVVDALYLPRVSEQRRRDAVERLARHCGSGMQVPVSIRRTVSVRNRVASGT